MSDPFRTRYDSRDIIGCDCDIVGGFSVDVSAETNLGDLSKKVEKEADKVIGKAAGKAVKAKAEVDAAISLGGDISEAVDDFDHTAKDVGQAIKDVAASPATHMVLAGVAAAAPPFSTIAAGLAEAGLAIGVAVVELVEELEDVWNDIVRWAECLLGCESPEQYKARLKAETKAKKQARQIAASIRSDASNKKLMKAEQQLAELRIAAKNGDKKALAAVISLDALMQKKTLVAVALAIAARKKMLDDLAKQGCTIEYVLEVQRNPGLGLNIAKARICLAALMAAQSLPKVTEKQLKKQLLLDAQKRWDKLDDWADDQLKKVAQKEIELYKQKGIDVGTSTKGNLYEGVLVIPGKTPKKAVFKKVGYDVTKHFLVDPKGVVKFGEYEKV